MCEEKYNGLNVFPIGLHIIRAIEIQEQKCEACRKLDICDRDCDCCIYYDENLKDFIELYSNQMSELL